MTTCHTPTNQCHSCLMPFAKDPGVRESDIYCSYCYQNGKLCFEGTKEESKRVVFAKMRERGIPWIQAKFFTWMINWAPRWKK